MHEGWRGARLLVERTDAQHTLEHAPSHAVQLCAAVGKAVLELVGLEHA
jgi:hypothetical protein